MRKRECRSRMLLFWMTSPNCQFWTKRFTVHRGNLRTSSRMQNGFSSKTKT
jgi:hypothetical protein